MSALSFNWKKPYPSFWSYPSQARQPMVITTPVDSQKIPQKAIIVPAMDAIIEQIRVQSDDVILRIGGKIGAGTTGEDKGI